MTKIAVNKTQKGGKKKVNAIKDGLLILSEMIKLLVKKF